MPITTDEAVGNLSVRRSPARAQTGLILSRRTTGF